jgi:large subunit ribosomal protein L25
VNISILPKDIPDYIEVDISELTVGDSLRVKDVVGDKFEFLDDPEDVICSVQAPKAIEEEEEAEEEEEEAAEPEVITAREKEEDSDSESE